MEWRCSWELHRRWRIQIHFQTRSVLQDDQTDRARRGSGQASAQSWRRGKFGRRTCCWWWWSFFCQTRDLQARRQQEELTSDLELSVYDTDRNEKSKIYRKLLVSDIDDRTNHARLLFVFFSNKKPTKRSVKRKFMMSTIWHHSWPRLVRTLTFVSSTNIISCAPRQPGTYQYSNRSATPCRCSTWLQRPFDTQGESDASTLREWNSRTDLQTTMVSETSDWHVQRGWIGIPTLVSRSSIPSAYSRGTIETVSSTLLISSTNDLLL